MVMEVPEVAMNPLLDRVVKIFDVDGDVFHAHDYSKRQGEFLGVFYTG